MQAALLCKRTESCANSDLINDVNFFDSSRKGEKEWGAENPSDVVNKFRNYEI